MAETNLFGLNDTISIKNVANIFIIVCNREFMYGANIVKEQSVIVNENNNFFSFESLWRIIKSVMCISNIFIQKPVNMYWSI